MLFPARPVVVNRPIQEFDEPVRDLTAAVKALVDDECIFVPHDLITACSFSNDDRDFIHCF